MRALPLALLALLAVGCGREERPLSGPVDVRPRREGAPPRDTPRAGELQIERVVDGDTFHATRNGRRVTVRLLRVNTAERGQFGYKQGTEELKRQLGEGPVRLESEGKDEKDRYGRTLAYVYVGERLVNLEMVRSGWSKYYTKYGKGGLEDEFKTAEEEARRARRGLWSR